MKPYEELGRGGVSVHIPLLWATVSKDSEGSWASCGVRSAGRPRSNSGWKGNMEMFQEIWAQYPDFNEKLKRARMWG